MLNVLKKSIIPLMILLSLSIVVAPTPCPFLFTFITSPPDVRGLTVEMKYMDKVFSVPETEPFEYSIDLGSQEIPNCMSQNFILTVKDCIDTPSCTRTVSFNNKGITTIDIRDANLFIPTTTIETTTTTTTEESTSITTTTPETTTTVPCEECKECPDETINYLVTGIVTAIISAGLTYGYGLKFYKKESGEVVTQHKHPGVRDYHSINIIHKNSKIRHPKGMIVPKYEKVGTEWQYKGG